MLKPLLMSAQPWLTSQTAPPKTLQETRWSGDESVIDTFNAQHNVHTLLERHGYKCTAPDRYLSPHSSTGDAGIVVLKGNDGRERVYCHHGSDPLGGTDHTHDAFGIYTILEHGGDVKAAVKAAAAELGLNSEARNHTAIITSTPANTEQVVEDPWPERQPLPRLYPPVPSLPPTLIPEPLRPWLVDIAERGSLPLEYVTCPALVALSAVVGRQVGIHPKRRDDWLVVPNLWGGIVGKPGLMKSAAISEPLKPLRALIAKAQEQYEEQKAYANAKRAQLELEIAALKENEKRNAKGRFKSE